MTAIDTNVLVGLLVRSSSFHEASVRGLEGIEDDLCVTPTNVGEVLRILTHPKVFQYPLKIRPALNALEEFFHAHAIRILDEDVYWWRELQAIEDLIPGLKGNEIFDARIAICLKQHNVKRIFTWDSDFKKYPFLKTVRPLKRP